MSIGKPLVDEWSGVVDVLLLLLSFFNIFTYAKLTSSKRLVDGMITYILDVFSRDSKFSPTSISLLSLISLFISPVYVQKQRTVNRNDIM